MNEHFIDALIFLMIHGNHHYGYHGFKKLNGSTLYWHELRESQ